MITTVTTHRQIHLSAVVHSRLLHPRRKFRLLVQLHPIYPFLLRFQRDLKQKRLFQPLARFLVYQSPPPHECAVIPLYDQETSLYLRNGSVPNMRGKRKHWTYRNKRPPVRHLETNLAPQRNRTIVHNHYLLIQMESKLDQDLTKELCKKMLLGSLFSYRQK